EYVVEKKDVKKMVCSNDSLEKITYLDSDYKLCVENLYNKYKENHEAISPLTATVEEFSKDLPKEVLIQKDKGKLNHFAFIEENEIAYIGSFNNSQMEEFLFLVIETLFKTYDTIEFEVDHNDKEMNLLKDCFYPQKCISYDTFIKSYKK
ncbi:MAG: hypothetical protein K2H06_03460, partial [Anaeroplasmataceae bacterium]|nr:hypothetical protein [Anaeroplasmataceae bacterium]